VKEIFVEILCDTTLHVYGARCGVVVKALRYKPAGHGFDSRFCLFSVQSFRCIMAVGSTQPLTETEYQLHFLGLKAAGV
jgi:hypothetical protein